MPRSVMPVSPPATARRRIVIMSAGVGAGHDGAAEQLAERLRGTGSPVDRHDFLDLLPGRFGPAVVGTYHRLLTWAPGGYQRLYAATERGSRPGPAVASLLRTARRRRRCARYRADTARSCRRTPAPARCSVRCGGAASWRCRVDVPDGLLVHALWVAPGIDAHLAAHPVRRPARRRRVRRRRRVVGPVVGRQFGPATAAERRAARAVFGLPADATARAAGGRVHGASGAVRAGRGRNAGVAKVAVPVVVCGRNEGWPGGCAREASRTRLGWVDDMPGLMHACDVLVQNAGGLTSLEAFAAGLPVASYRCIPGHGQTNAAALDEAGLAPGYGTRRTSTRSCPRGAGHGPGGPRPAVTTASRRGGGRRDPRGTAPGRSAARTRTPPPALRPAAATVVVRSPSRPTACAGAGADDGRRGDGTAGHRRARWPRRTGTRPAASPPSPTYLEGT